MHQASRVVRLRNNPVIVILLVFDVNYATTVKQSKYQHTAEAYNRGWGLHGIPLDPTVNQTPLSAVKRGVLQALPEPLCIDPILHPIDRSCRSDLVLPGGPGRIATPSAYKSI